MKHEPDQHVRHVHPPSGETIEVASFEAREGAPELRLAPSHDEGALHLCGTCSAALVYPVEWEEENATHWRVSLCCPNCGWEGTGVFAQETVDRFDEELDRGTEALVRDLKRLMSANMQEEIDRFVVALRDGHILPSDF